MTLRVLATVVGGALFCSAVGAQSSSTSTSASANFEVAATLSSRCQVSGTAPTVNFETYTAFQSQTLTKTANVAFVCTRGLTPTSVSFTPPSATLGVATQTGAKGTIGGLHYELSAQALSPAPGTAATTTTTGTADTRTYKITGTMASGQAGCTGSGTTGDNCSGSTQQWTLVIGY